MWHFLFSAFYFEKKHCYRQESSISWLLSNFEQTAIFSFRLTAIFSRQSHEFWWKLKKWVSCTYQALFSAEITVTQTKYTLDKYHEYFNINFEGKRIVYWISQWLHKHKWHRTFWKLNWCRKQMKVPRIWCWPIGDESY